MVQSRMGNSASVQQPDAQPGVVPIDEINEILEMPESSGNNFVEWKPFDSAFQTFNDLSTNPSVGQDIQPHNEEENQKKAAYVRGMEQQEVRRQGQQFPRESQEEATIAAGLRQFIAEQQLENPQSHMRSPNLQLAEESNSQQRTPTAPFPPGLSIPQPIQRPPNVQQVAGQPDALQAVPGDLSPQLAKQSNSEHLLRGLSMFQPYQKSHNQLLAGQPDAMQRAAPSRGTPSNEMYKLPAALFPPELSIPQPIQRPPNVQQVAGQPDALQAVAGDLSPQLAKQSNSEHLLRGLSMFQPHQNSRNQQLAGQPDALQGTAQQVGHPSKTLSYLPEFVMPQPYQRSEHQQQPDALQGASGASRPHLRTPAELGNIPKTEPHQWDSEPNYQQLKGHTNMTAPLLQESSMSQSYQRSQHQQLADARQEAGLVRWTGNPQTHLHLPPTPDAVWMVLVLHRQYQDEAVRICGHDHKRPSPPTPQIMEREFKKILDVNIGRNQYPEVYKKLENLNEDQIMNLGLDVMSVATPYMERVDLLSLFGQDSIHVDGFSLYRIMLMFGEIDDTAEIEMHCRLFFGALRVSAGTFNIYVHIPLEEVQLSSQLLAIQYANKVPGAITRFVSPIWREIVRMAANRTNITILPTDLRKLEHGLTTLVIADDPSFIFWADFYVPLRSVNWARFTVNKSIEVSIYRGAKGTFNVSDEAWKTPKFRVLPPVMQSITKRSPVRVPLAFLAAEAILTQNESQGEFTVTVVDMGLPSENVVKYDRGNRVQNYQSALELALDVTSGDISVTMHLSTAWQPFAVAYFVLARRGNRKISQQQLDAVLKTAAICQISAYRNNEIQLTAHAHPLNEMLRKVTWEDATYITDLMKNAPPPTYDLDIITIADTLELCLYESIKIQDYCDYTLNYDVLSVYNKQTLRVVYELIKTDAFSVHKGSMKTVDDYIQAVHDAFSISKIEKKRSPAKTGNKQQESAAYKKVEEKSPGPWQSGPDSARPRNHSLSLQLALTANNTAAATARPNMATANAARGHMTTARANMAAARANMATANAARCDMTTARANMAIANAARGDMTTARANMATARANMATARANMAATRADIATANAARANLPTGNAAGVSEDARHGAIPRRRTNRN